MQKLFSFLLVAAAICNTPQAWSAQSVPYTSELGTPYGISSEWYNTRGNGTKAWSNVTGDFGGQWGNTGCTNGIQYVYSETSDADAWLISPEISLEAAKDYYLTIWVRTEFSPENFRVTVAEGDTPAQQRAGTVLIDMNNETVMGRWKRLRKSFRVDETGNYNFGLNCYSKANQFTLYVTGFSLTEGDGTHAVEVFPAADPVTKALPYKAEFPADCTHWSAIRGSMASGQGTWYYDEADNSYAFVDPDEQEDNWLVSPALDFTEAGDYKISVSAESFGVLDWFLGTDPADPATFTTPLGGTSYPGTTGATLVSVDRPGTYHVGFHAHAENGSTMGYGVYALNVRMVKEWPQPVTDLRTTVDPSGAMKVTLQWTNPSLTLKGNQLDALTHVEIYRDGTLIDNISDAVPGKSCTFVDDKVDVPGIHTYKVLPYNALGASTEDVREVETMYVGGGAEPFPYSWTTGSEREHYEALTKWITHNPAGEPYYEWKIDFGWRYCWTSMKLPGKQNDDYLATPYIALEKGYYKVSFEVNDRHANYDFGYITDRADIPGTFVPAANFRMSDVWNNHENSAIINIPADGNYAMAWHHVGGTDDNCRIELYSIRMEKINPLPAIAEDLTATAAQDFSLSTEISWTNPAIDNAGNPLASITRVILLRNAERIADFKENLSPGKKMSFTDTDIPQAAEYEYAVEVFNENGKAQSLPASVKVYVGKGEAIPYEARLQGWTRHNLDRDNYAWGNMEGGGITFYSRFSDSNDWAVSPHVYLEPEKEYEIAVETSTISEYPVYWDLCTSRQTDPASMTTLETITIPASAERHTDIVRITTSSDNTGSLPVFAPGNHIFAAHATGMGTINLHSFKITEAESGGIGATAVGDSARITVDGDRLTLPDGTETVRIYDISGRLLSSPAITAGSMTIPATSLPSGVSIIETTGSYGTARLKIAR